MKLKWKLWLLPLAAVLALGLFKGGDLWGNKNEITQQELVQTVVVEGVKTAKKENLLSLTGTVEALDSAVVSSKVAGRVSRVAVDNGAAVGAGQTLVSLENQEYLNMVAASRATLQKAEANLASVRANYDRMKELFQAGAISKKDFEDIETGLKIAEADAGSAAAALANAEESLRNTSISAPFGGVVASRSVNVGQVVSPGLPLMAVHNISSVYVLVNIEQGELPKISQGMPARVALDAYGDRRFDGAVALISPAANQAARVFETKVKVNNAEQIFKPGMFARVEIKTGADQEVLAVPRDAITGKEGMFFVFLAEGDKAVRRQVEIGQIIDQLVEIKSGLTGSEQVIVTNVNKLKDGDKITSGAWH